jgi:hypothetical protein
MVLPFRVAADASRLGWPQRVRRREHHGTQNRFGFAIGKIAGNEVMVIIHVDSGAYAGDANIASGEQDGLSIA